MMWLNTWVPALVATIWWRVSAVRTKKTSSSGPATPAVRLVPVTMKPASRAWPGREASTFTQPSGSQTRPGTRPISR